MLSFSDIMKLRKEGKLREAYEAAQQLLALEPDDVWAKRAMMWVVYDYAKQNTAPDKREGFLRCVHQMTFLQIPAEEDMFYNSAGILVRNVVRKCVGDPSATGFLSALWEELRQWNWTIPGKAYSGLLLSFLKVKDQWPLFADFCEWWNFDHLTDEDFEAMLLPDGNKDLPLAEKAYMAYSKALLRLADRNRIRLWLPVLEDLVKLHPNYVFLSYYCVKLQLLSGEKNKVVDLLKPLAIKKSGEFWVWELIADALCSGGWFGKGLGNSVQKMGYIPEVQTDMIFTVICEELGIFGAIMVIAVFLMLLWRLLHIAVNAPDMFGGLIATGVLTHIALQVLLNIAVVTGTIPATGIPFPFISYGGSSLTVLLIEMGIALSVSKYTNRERATDE